MFHHLFLKFVGVFFLGVVFAFLAFKMVQPPTNSSVSVLGAETVSFEEDPIKAITQNVLANLLSHISQSPALEPLVTTTQSVQDTVTEVQALPDAQRQAICQEICVAN